MSMTKICNYSQQAAASSESAASYFPFSHIVGKIAVALSSPSTLYFGEWNVCAIENASLAESPASESFAISEIYY